MLAPASPPVVTAPPAVATMPADMIAAIEGVLVVGPEATGSALDIRAPSPLIDDDKTPPVMPPSPEAKAPLPRPPATGAPLGPGVLPFAWRVVPLTTGPGPLALPPAVVRPPPGEPLLAVPDVVPVLPLPPPAALVVPPGPEEVPVEPPPLPPAVEPPPDVDPPPLVDVPFPDVEPLLPLVPPELPLELLVDPPEPFPEELPPLLDDDPPLEAELPPPLDDPELPVPMPGPQLPTPALPCPVPCAKALASLSNGLPTVKTMASAVAPRRWLTRLRDVAWVTWARRIWGRR